MNSKLERIPVTKGEDVYRVQGTTVAMRTYSHGFELGVVTPVTKGKHADTGLHNFKILSFSSLNGLADAVVNTIMRSEAYIGQSALDVVGSIQKELKTLQAAAGELHEVFKHDI